MDVGCNHEQLNEVQHQLKEKNSKCVILLSLKFTDCNLYYLSIKLDAQTIFDNEVKDAAVCSN